MSVPFYPFHFLPFKPKQENELSILSVKTPKQEGWKNTLKIFFSFHSLLSSEALGSTREFIKEWNEMELNGMEFKNLVWML